MSPATGAVAYTVAGQDYRPLARTSDAVYAADGPADPAGVEENDTFDSPRLLAESDDIDPASLRVRGRTVTWRRNGRTRSAVLAPVSYPGEARCARGGRVLARGPQAVVVAGRAGTEICRPADGRRHVIAGGVREGSYVVAGPFAAAVTPRGRIRVWSAAGRTVRDVIPPASDVRFGLSPTGRLALLLAGCFTAPSLGPSCTPTRIAVADGAERSAVREVTSDFGIDPSSLRVAGRTAFWTQDGRERSISLG